MAKLDMHTFSDMPGTKGKITGPHASSISGVLRLIRSHRLVCAAGDHGCLNVWRDDAGILRAEFQRWRQTIDSVTPHSNAALHRWLLVWFPKMRERPNG